MCGVFLSWMGLSSLVTLVIILKSDELGKLLRKIRELKVYTRCYEEVGCFSTGGEFSNFLVRPIQFLPLDPKGIPTRFFLRHKKKRKGFDVLLRANDDKLFDRAHLDLTKPLVFLIHGFLQSAMESWVLQTSDALLEARKVSVVLVDWSFGSRWPYAQATANTRLVGAQLALLLRYLRSKGLNMKLVHLVGHSLGAHAAGYAGKRMTKDKIGRITALDPAGLYFSGMTAAARLHRTDAEFVDVVHTNGGAPLASFGMAEAIGSVDFFVNGGEEQLPCQEEDNPLGFGCDHKFSTEIFKASIFHECSAYRCAYHEKFLAGSCLPTGAAGRIPFGFDAAKAGRTLSRKPENRFELETLRRKPYCGFLYKADIILTKESNTKTAQFDFILEGVANSSVTEQTVTFPNRDKFVRIASGETYSRIFVLPKQLNITGLQLRARIQESVWDILGWFRPSTIKIASIAFLSADTNRSAKYCFNADIFNRRKYTFHACV